MVQQLINNIVGNLPPAIYWQLREDIPLGQGSAVMESSSLIQVMLSDTSSIQESVDTDETGIEEYVSSRPSKIKSYRRRTKTGVQRVDSHTRENPQSTLRERVAKVMKRGRLPLKTMPIDMEDVMNEAVAKAVHQVVDQVRAMNREF